MTVPASWFSLEGKRWGAQRLKIVADQIDERVDPTATDEWYLDLEHVESGTGKIVSLLPGAEVPSSPDSTVKRFNAGDLLIGKLRPYLAKVAIAPFSGVCSSEFIVIRPRQGVHRGFFAYVLLCEQFISWINSYTVGAKMPRVDPERVMTTRIPLPSFEEQEAISGWLDERTTQVDELIALKGELRKLLAERRIAAIGEAVTKGVATTELKDSGIPGIGAVPSHWDVVRNKTLFREVDERVGSSAALPELLSVSHLTGVSARSEKKVYMFMAESFEGYKTCQPGDLVINTMWAWMGAAGVSRIAGMVSPSYNVYRPRELGRCDPAFVDFLVRTPGYVSEMGQYSKGVWRSRLRLYPDVFLRMRSPMPPKDEQLTIVRSIEESVKPVDELIERLDESVAHLRRLRSTLISSAVTGAVDVKKKVA